MKVGLTFDLKSEAGSSRAGLSGYLANSGSDDAEEEFDSPETVDAVSSVLRALGHEPIPLGNGEAFIRRLLDGPRPDIVFNFAEGRGVGRTREARVPAFLEMLGIPYTGSDPLTLAATLDKTVAKRLVSTENVVTPKWVVVDASLSADDISRRLMGFPLPAIVKPAFEGSSKGIRNASVVSTVADLSARVLEVTAGYRQPVLIEEFVIGDELTVGVLGTGDAPEIIGVMRVLPVEARPHFVYSLEVKRDWRRQVRYECPAALSAAEIRAVHEATTECWRVLGCRDVSRFDFRLRDGIPYFLEVNPLPGLSPETGDIVILSKAMDLSYHDLVARILQTAMKRAGLTD